MTVLEDAGIKDIDFYKAPYPAPAKALTLLSISGYVGLKVAKEISLLRMRVDRRLVGDFGFDDLPLQAQQMQFARDQIKAAMTEVDFGSLPEATRLAFTTVLEHENLWITNRANDLLGHCFAKALSAADACSEIVAKIDYKAHTEAETAD